MTNKLYSFSNFIETRYTITETTNGFQITKTLVNVTTKKVTTKVYKTITATYNAAVAFISKCCKISDTLSVIYSKARKLALDAKVDNCKAFFQSAKVAIAEDLQRMGKFVNRFGSH